MKHCFTILPLLVTLAGAPAIRTVSAQSVAENRYFTTSDGVRLHYLEAGSGPTIVFVPGWTMPAEVWEFQIRHFANSHRVIALDPRGHGRSDKANFGYHPSRRAQDIAELIEHVSDEPVVLVGWSLGVQEAVVYVQEHGTDRVRALVLVDWDMIDENPGRFADRFIQLQVNREEWMRRFVRAIVLHPPSEEYLEQLVQAALSVPVNATAIMIANIIHMGPNDLRPAMAGVDRPVLFVYSALNWAAPAAEEARAAWPEARVEIMKDTSHTLFVDQPDAFNRLLDSFLETARTP